jgi:hypothetical protein
MSVPVAPGRVLHHGQLVRFRNEWTQYEYGMLKIYTHQCSSLVVVVDVVVIVGHPPQQGRGWF